MSDEIITKEIIEKFPYCQNCGHGWNEHINECSNNYCTCKATVSESILNKVMDFNGKKIMIDVFDDFFMIRKENNSDEYLIRADNTHSCNASYGLVSWKFIGIQNKIEAVFLCSKCNETFTDTYHYVDTENYQETGITNPFEE